MTSLRYVEPTHKVGEAQGGFFTSFRRAGASLKNGVVTRHARRLMRFCVVGVSGVVVNTALLYLLTEAGGLSPLVAALFSTEAAILNNFLFNDRWTFSDTEPGTSWYWRALRYNFVALAGLVISLAVLAGLTYVLGLHYLVANLFAIGAGSLWNYAGSSYFIWATFKTSIPADRVSAELSGWGRRFVSLLIVGVRRLWT
jgi:putative flippase GtrA